VLAAVERSDSYPELPWKAFALGASIAGLKVSLLALLSPASFFVSSPLFAIIALLAAGGAAALCCVFIPPFARLFLDRRRAEMEVRQHAGSLFLSRELFATRDRTGILLLVSRFERTAVVLSDSGIKTLLNEDSVQRITAQMSGLLAANQVAAALEAGLLHLEQLPGRAGQAGVNELPNGIVQEEGS
jgi:putative membrane protein